MIHVTMTLTEGQGHMSRSKFAKNYTIDHILDAISPTDSITSIITAFCGSFGCCLAHLDVALEILPLNLKAAFHPCVNVIFTNL